MTHITPLTPTASMLLESLRTDHRSVLAVVSSDLHVSRMFGLIVDFLGFETALPKLYQQVGGDAIARLGIAIDLWISGSRVRSETVSGSQMSLGCLVVACLSPMALEQSLSDTDAQLQFDTASFGLFSCLANSVTARQEPEKFEQAASVARLRQIPILDAYETVNGEPLRLVCRELARAWGLPRELMLALGGHHGLEITPREKLMINAVNVATLAAQSAGVALEPWPYAVKTDRIEEIALISAMGMRAKRVATRLEEALQGHEAA